MSIAISNYLTPSSPAVSPDARGATVSEAAAPAVSDRVTLQGQSPAPVTYADPRSGTAQAAPDLASMLEESIRKAQAIIDLIVPLVKQQGLNMAKVVSGEERLTADAATIAKAKAAIAAEGEFSAKQVAERILNFAKLAMGGDPSKLGAIRAAVEKGFEEAAAILGGTLPQISSKTHDVIMAEFERWQSDGIPEGDAVSLPPRDEEDEAQP